MKKYNREESIQEIREILSRRPELLDRVDPFKRMVCEAIMSDSFKEKGDTAAAKKTAGSLPAVSNS